MQLCEHTHTQRSPIRDSGKGLLEAAGLQLTNSELKYLYRRSSSYASQLLLPALDLPLPTRQVLSARIHPPSFVRSSFVIPSNNSSTCAAINAAIDTTHNAGGERVLLLAGVWISNGPINLKSDVNLHLSVGAMATLRCGTIALDYLPAVHTKFEGTLLYNYSPLIRGYEVTNAALTSERGSVIGFSQWRRRHNQTANQNALRKMGNDTTAHYMRVFGAGHFLRPVFVQFFLRFLAARMCY